ncbi:MAG: sugar phosphate isomerase/epimerase [Oscillospiraceae bacterium]|nr:sugar phosphate isomerase/epimerase [Oscillospiraceae bacterium]
MAQFILSAFADEGAREGILGQIAVLKENGVSYIEPRGLDHGNISEYTPEQAKELKKVLDDSGIGVSAMGSPFGKVPISQDDEDFEEHFELFKVCVENACILGTENIRMFSFYFDEGEAYGDYKDLVFERLAMFSDYSLKSGVYCCHENERGIYGSNDTRCLEILKAFEGKIKGVFDPANYILDGVEILPAYEMLEPYIEYFHVKDARFSDRRIVPAGKGDAGFPELLKRFKKKDGKRFLTIEPHLKVFKGFAELEKEGGGNVIDEFAYPDNKTAFKAAADAIKELIK